MKILHLYSDWKWTGPAEPTLQACLSLQERGHDVLIAFRKPQQEYNESVELKVQEMGLKGATQFALDRYVHPVATLSDLIKLPRFIKREKFDLVHAHLSHDHAIGALCVKMLGRDRPLLVRSLYRREVRQANLLSRVQFRWLTDGFLTFTDGFREEYVRRFGLAPECVDVLPMPIDLDRFSPAAQVRDMREEFGILPAAPVIGIVGRFQRYRRMEVFLEAARRLVAEEPRVRFLIIGRSSKMKETVVRPVEELGLGEHVVLTGYRIKDYVDTLACQDVFTLLMPGFDGTARAVREALALGKPCVVANFGMLPDIVKHGETGLLVDNGDPGDLAQAWLTLIRKPEQRLAMGQAARRDAEERFRIDAVGPRLEAFYERLLAKRAVSRGA